MVGLVAENKIVNIYLKVLQPEDEVRDASAPVRDCKNSAAGADPGSSLAISVFQRFAQHKVAALFATKIWFARTSRRQPISDDL